MGILTQDGDRPRERRAAKGLPRRVARQPERYFTV